jgi:hypothetical protein
LKILRRDVRNYFARNIPIFPHIFGGKIFAEKCMKNRLQFGPTVFVQNV